MTNIPPPRTPPRAFKRSVIEDPKKSFVSKLGNLKYTRPEKAEELVGITAMGFLGQALDRGLRLHGGGDSLGFLFFYELVTDSLRARVLTDDKPFNLASLLVRFLPPEDWSQRSELMSALRAITEDYTLSIRLPKYRHDTGPKLNLPKINLFGSLDSAKRLLKVVAEMLEKEPHVAAFGKKVCTNRSGGMWRRYLPPCGQSS